MWDELSIFLIPFRPQPNEVAPEGYRSYLEDPGFQARETIGANRAAFIGGGGIWGMRATLGPLVFDKYMGDAEPTVETGGPLRLVVWQPVRRLTAPKGWSESRLVDRKNATGHAHVPAEGDYMGAWSSHAKRHTRKWRAQKEGWVLEPVSVEEFALAYKGAKIDGILKMAFVGLLKQKMRSHGGLLHILGARQTPGGPVVAGFVYLHIPEAKQMYHVISFILPRVKDTEVGYGLMDHWFAHAQRIGVDILDFGVFWTPGDPPSWKGFSRFKSQFGVENVYYPRAFVRLGGSLKNTLTKGRK